ncbi:DUF5405 family protein [Serratia sp. JSRIV002]|uniref:DUF5405 family protein n=1 Tax=Serratia sp. JSRIV002 TaxID=2831894 RepID=UPI001CBAE25B|nr:DUF5405 family protein [Serratia sp. JSRIV002]UAN53728.1 DUF5405 family protein [Serratia sp. JSRIV002]
MTIRIKVDDRFVITSDQYQFIINHRKVGKTGKGAGEERLEPFAYCQTISQLVNALIHISVRDSTARTLASLAAEVERIGQKCEEAFKHQGERKEDVNAGWMQKIDLSGKPEVK